MTPDFRRLALLARLSALVYETDLNVLARGVSGLGLEYRGVVRAPGFQAMVAHEESGDIIVYRGTPVTCARDIADWLAAVGSDILIDKTVFTGGRRVLTAPYKLVKSNLSAVLRQVDQSKPITVTGHSLGAVMGLIAGALIPTAAVSVFAPFQAASKEYWASAYSGRPPTIVGRRNDFALGFDHLDPDTTHAGVICRLTAAKAVEWRVTWPVQWESVGDHDVAGYADDMTSLSTL